MIVARQNGESDLSLNTPILTTRGWSTMGEVKPDEWVFGSAGQPVRIVACSDVFLDHLCYEVEFTDGSRYIASEDHLWHVKNRYADRWTDVRTGDLFGHTGGVRADTGRMEYNWRVRCDAVPDTPAVDLPIDPYLLGYWLGDGHSNAAGIVSGAEDLEWISARMEQAGARILRRTRHDHGHAWGLHFRLDAKMRDGFESRCRRLGIWGDKHIPEVYLTASVEQRKALLAGLMDSDGSIAVTNRSPQVEFTTSIPALASGFHRLARSLGIRVTRREGKSTFKGVRYRDRSRFLWTPAFNPFQLPRKAVQFTAPLSHRHEVMSVTGVRPVETVSTRCIHVDAVDGVYLVGHNFTPTHNSILEALERRVSAVIQEPGARPGGPPQGTRERGPEIEIVIV